MSQDGMSDSRFHMWRAVFAMAHVDGNVTQEEVDFARNYLDRAMFSDAQKEVLSEDLIERQSVGEMLAFVSDPADQSDFFQFSQMLAWADGDYSAQEKVLVDRVSGEQMAKFSKDDVAQNLRNARKAAILRRAVEDVGFEAQARDVSGFANVIRYVAPWVEMKNIEAPDDQMFKLWRAVFGLVHVDGDVSEEEESYINGMMDVFHFSDQQREAIKSDLSNPEDDIVTLFEQVNSVRHRKQFFILARTIVWCDGIFHDDERDALEAVKASLGARVEDYASEIRFLDRKPVPPEGLSGENDEERMMQDVVRQMVEFYKGDE